MAHPLDPAFYAFLEQVFDWNSRRYFPYTDRMTLRERRYVEGVLALITDRSLGWRPSSTGPALSSVSFSHRVRGERVNSTRVSVGTVEHPHAAESLAMPVLAERGIDPRALCPAGAELIYYGIGWDFATNGFKLYYVVPRLDELRAARPGFFAHAPPEYRTEGLWALNFVNNKPVDEKLYFYPINDTAMPAELARGTRERAIVVSSARKVFSQYDVNDSTAWYARLNETGQAIVREYWSQLLELDTLAWQDRDTFTLYFP